MKKYENMLKANREKNAFKERKAIETIRRMVKNGDPVSVAILAKKTGLSKSMLYNNEKVREELVIAKEMQKNDARIHLRPEAINKTKDMEIKRLNEKVVKLESALEKKDKKIEDLMRKNKSLEVAKKAHLESIF